jgi:hypothetical protein
MILLETIKKILHINFHDYYRFRYLLDRKIISSNKPRINYDLYIIKSEDELDTLLQAGCDFGESTITGLLAKNVDGNKTLFLYFVDKQLAHHNCVEENDSSNDPTLKEFKDSKSVFVGPTYTTEQYRGKGFHVFDLEESFIYYYKKGYKKIYASTKTSNTASIMGLMSAEFEMIDKVRLYRFNKFSICKSLKHYKT